MKKKVKSSEPSDFFFLLFSQLCVRSSVLWLNTPLSFANPGFPKYKKRLQPTLSTDPRFPNRVLRRLSTKKTPQHTIVVTHKGNQALMKELHYSFLVLFFF